ncbi:Protein fmp32, mitochondrial [Collariella sp. IMI 366227]|nr:Protein fmp32, mitochondrial [Collariella sp. IMI 366227]
MNATQTLPRFLLPRLSWTGPISPATSIPGASAVVFQQARSSANRAEWQRASRRPLHTSGARPIGHCDSTLRDSARRPTRSPSSIVRNPALRRSFHATAARRRDHHFDTLRFVQRLQEEGFTEEQSVAMMKVLNDVIEESIQNLTRTMVPREEAAKTTYTQKVDFAKLRSELLSADSTESNATRAAHEKLTNDIAKLSSRLRDEIGRTQASVRLDLNLEKGRIREEAVSQELKIKETETKIEQEAAALRQQLEQVKFQTLQWLMGVCTGFAALLLGAWRLLM